jgi:hypothetical protein
MRKKWLWLTADETCELNAQVSDKDDKRVFNPKTIHQFLIQPSTDDRYRPVRNTRQIRKLLKKYRLLK